MFHTSNIELDPAQCLQCLTGQDLPQNGLLAGNQVSPLPVRECSIKAEAERYEALRVSGHNVGGIVSAQIKSASRPPNFIAPEGIRYSDRSYLGGELTFSPAEFPIIAKSSCLLPRESLSLDNKWQPHYKLRSTKIYRVSYGRPSPPSAKLISINPAAPERPSGKSFVLRLTGTFKFTPRKCCGELCLVSEDFGSLAAFEQTALTVGKAENIDGGQILRVATAEKLDVDTDLANNLLASGKLCLEFRETFQVHKHPNDVFLVHTRPQSQFDQPAAANLDNQGAAFSSIVANTTSGQSNCAATEPMPYLETMLGGETCSTNQPYHNLPPFYSPSPAQGVFDVNHYLHEDLHDEGDLEVSWPQGAANKSPPSSHNWLHAGIVTPFV